MKKKWWVFLAASLIGIVVFILLMVFKPTFVIRFGIRSFHIAQLCVLGLTAISFGIPVVFIITSKISTTKELAEQHRQERLIAESQIEEKRRVNIRDAPSTTIKEKLIQISLANPRLSNIITCCLSQIEFMNRQQARLQQLIDSNDALFAEGAMDALDRVEAYLCNNFRRIINIFVANGCNEGGVFLEHISGIKDVEGYIRDNEQKLREVQSLVQNLALAINNDNDEYDLAQFNAWLDTLSSNVTTGERR